MTDVKRLFKFELNPEETEYVFLTTADFEECITHLKETNYSFAFNINIERDTLIIEETNPDRYKAIAVLYDELKKHFKPIHKMIMDSCRFVPIKSYYHDSRAVKFYLETQREDCSDLLYFLNDSFTKFNALDETSENVYILPGAIIIQGKKKVKIIDKDGERTEVPIRKADKYDFTDLKTYQRKKYYSGKPPPKKKDIKTRIRLNRGDIDIIDDIVVIESNNNRITSIWKSLEQKRNAYGKEVFIKCMAESLSHFHIALSQVILPNKLYLRPLDAQSKILMWNLIFRIVRSFECSETRYHARVNDFKRYTFPIEHMFFGDALHHRVSKDEKGNDILVDGDKYTFYGKTGPVNIIRPIQTHFQPIVERNNARVKFDRTRMIERLISISRGMLKGLFKKDGSTKPFTWDRKNELGKLYGRINHKMFKEYLKAGGVIPDDKDFSEAFGEFRRETQRNQRSRVPHYLEMYVCGSIMPRLLLDTEGKYADEYNKADIDIVVYSDQFDYAVEEVIFPAIKKHCYTKLELKKIGNISEGYYRYHIINTRSGITIELFKTKKDIYNLIRSFHVAAVRSFLSLQDHEVYCCPSFIGMIRNNYICNNLCWFSCMKKPIDILTKYFRRGFGFVLNNSDTATLAGRLTTEGIEFEIEHYIINSDNIEMEPIAAPIAEPIAEPIAAPIVEPVREMEEEGEDDPIVVQPGGVTSKLMNLLRM